MTVSSVSCGPSDRPKRPRSRAITTPPSRAIASNFTRLPGQVCVPRLATRTRQSVTVSEEVEKSFSIEKTRSCQGSSSGDPDSARASRRTDPMEIPLADGAMGTLLVSRGASPEQAKSPLNLTDPESVREVHDDYRDAGARILTTNTWDANRVKLTAHEWSDSLEKINREGVRIARESAAGELAFVAGSVGPLGALVKPYGSLTLVGVREIFEEQIRALLEAGVDLLLFETFGSLLEGAEAVRAARGLSGGIPIVAEMTFLSDGRTTFGENASHALATLTLAGADAVGMNCTLGPQETHDVFTRLPASIAGPLSVMPNAGYPTLVHGRNVYLSSPDYLRDYARAYAEAGAAIIGGCCGTTPEHIRAMARAISGAKRAPASTRASLVV